MIVIIGMIVAGVVAGQSLVQQAKIRAIIGDVDRITVAVNSFKLQYNALPGDIPNAYAYWGGVLGCANATSSAGAQGNCNGDGNNRIEYANATGKIEGLKAWQHLALANLMEGSYTGTASTYACTPKINAPSNPLGGGYNLQYYQTWNTLLIGGINNIDDACFGSLFVPKDLYNIDIKIDDGAYTTGRLLPRTGNLGTNATTCDAGTSYNLASNNKECVVRVKFGL